MRKLALVVGSLLTVVLLALLMYVADGDADEVPYEGSYDHLRGHEPRGAGQDEKRAAGKRRHHKPGKPPHPVTQPLPGMPPARERPTYLDAAGLTCRIEGGQLVLGWTYGASERVAPFVDARGEGLVVGVEVVKPGPDVMVPMIALTGEARFADFGEPAWIRNPDGTDLPCATSSAAHP